MSEKKSERIDCKVRFCEDEHGFVKVVAEGPCPPGTIERVRKISTERGLLWPE